MPGSPDAPRSSPSIDTTTDPWVTLSDRRVYDNAWIRVTEFQVLTPAGTPGLYGVVHFKARSVCILPVDDLGHVTLVGQYRYPLKAWSWELPEGGCPLGTDPLVAARRELAEETGLAAGAWREILRLHLSNSVTDETAVSFLAWDLTQGAAHPEETERLALRRVPFAEAVDMAARGAITDAHTVATLFRARLMAMRGELPAAIAAQLAY